MLCAQSAAKLRQVRRRRLRPELHRRRRGTRYATNWSNVAPGGTGWKTSTIHLGWLRLPYVSYESEHVLWYAGWQWSGFFGFKFNVKNSAVQLW